jgi:hypothetical protein
VFALVGRNIVGPTVHAANQRAGLATASGYAREPREPRATSCATLAREARADVAHAVT